jgi:SAM-dependent methyltransferase
MQVDRRAWLEERRRAVIDDYDRDAATYGDDPYPAEEQRRYVARLLELLPPDGLVLDAPCGAGRYFRQIAESGRRVVGIDQSSGMLAAARTKGIAEALHHVGLQELAFEHAFDGVMSIDAMENVPPDDWPLVLANLHRALKPGGYLYMTSEEQRPELIDQAFAALIAEGAPAVHGEVVEGDTAGYHYYPGRERVLDWLAAEGLEVLEETDATPPEADWGYRHLLLRDPASRTS